MFGRNENPKDDKDAAALDDLSLSSPMLPGTTNKTPSNQVSQEHSNLWTNPHKRARDWLKRKHEAKQGGVFVHHSTIREKIHREIEHVKGLFKAANKPEPTSEEIIVYYDAGHPRESSQAQVAEVAEVAEVASEEIMVYYDAGQQSKRSQGVASESASEEITVYYDTGFEKNDKSPSTKL